MLRSVPGLNGKMAFHKNADHMFCFFSLFFYVINVHIIKCEPEMSFHSFTQDLFLMCKQLICSIIVQVFRHKNTHLIIS